MVALDICWAVHARDGDRRYHRRRDRSLARGAARMDPVRVRLGAAVHPGDGSREAAGGVVAAGQMIVGFGVLGVILALRPDLTRR